MSGPFVSLILLSNSLFFSNYLFIKSERRLADAQTEAKLHLHQRATEDEDERPKGNARMRIEAMLKGFVFGFCFGIVKKEMNSLRRFRDWEPIRHRLSLVTTSALLLLFTALFSDGLLKKLGANPSGTYTKPQLCSTQNKNGHFMDLQRNLNTQTNIVQARRQYNYTVRFLEALQSDTNLYGTDGYTCPMKPQTKEDYYETTQYKKKSYEDFFPGHCAAAQALALKNAREQTCVKKLCFNTTVEVEVPDIDMSGVSGAWNYVTQGKDGVISTKTVQQDVDVCQKVTVPCPYNEEADEIDDALDDYKYNRTKMREKIQEVRLTQSQERMMQQAQETGTEVASTLLRQVDIASSAYVGYICLSLFFPAPLFLFRSNYFITAKRYLFGAQKHVFIIAVLSVWWGLKYFKFLSLNLELKLYLRGLIKDPCFGDAEYLTAAPKSMEEMCHELIVMETDWTIRNTLISDILEEVEAFRDLCQCDYPCESLCGILPQIQDYETRSLLHSINFGTSLDQSEMCSYCDSVDVLVPDVNATFVGNTTICKNAMYAKEMLMGSSAPESNVNWWGLWISTGLLAMIFVKTFVANFGVSILHLADPLSACNGEYEGPPSRHDFGSEYSLYELKIMAEHNLQMIAVRRCLFWGGLSNLCLLNILVATLSHKEGYVASETGSSMTTAAICATAFLPPALTYWYTKATDEKIERIQSQIAA